jgi:pimeloyl-ACP methyl ester carboxylesterase
MTWVSGKPRENDLPVAFRLLRAALKFSALFSTELTGRWVNHLWFRTQRFPEPAREQEWLASAERLTLTHGGRPLAVYRWGAGPTVLLVHGWHGRGTQLGAFVAPLVAAGFRVVAFDAPAHGRTPGRATNLPEVSEALSQVAAAFPPLHGVIAHSFGAASTLHAISQGLAPRRVVTLSSPASIEFLLDSFAAQLELPDAVMNVHRRMLVQRFGADVWRRLSPTENARGLNIPALLVHDVDDHDVPWQQGEILARTWPGATSLQTQGLGHRRILRDPDVVTRSVAFMAESSAHTD